jgi:hypothetical protein
MNTIRLSVYMPTISKTSEGNLICLDTTRNYARIGKAVLSLLVMMKDAKDLRNALLVMDGRNNSSTH